MLSKKAAGLVGLGATMTGAVGSQMTSASLIDLMKKDQGNYQQHLEKEKFHKYESATKNIIETMCRILPDNEDVVNVFERLKNSLSRDDNERLTDEEKKSLFSTWDEDDSVNFSFMRGWIQSVTNNAIGSGKIKKDEDPELFYKGVITDLLEKVAVTKTKEKGSKEKVPFSRADYFGDIFQLSAYEDILEYDKEYEELTKVLDTLYEKILNNKTVKEQDITEFEKSAPITTVTTDLSRFLDHNNLKDDLLKGSLKDDAKDKILKFIELVELRGIDVFYGKSTKGRKIVLNELGYQSTGDKAVSYALTGGKFAAKIAVNAFFITKVIVAATATLFTHGGAAPLLFGLAATGVANAATSTITGTGRSYIEENLNKSKDSVHTELNVQKSLFKIFQEEGKDGVKKAIASAIFSGLEDVATSVIDVIDPDLINNISEKITNSVSDFFKEGLDKIPNIDATLENVNEYVEHIIKENPGLTKDQISEMVSKLVTDQIKEQLVVSPVTETIEKKVVEPYIINNNVEEKEAKDKKK